MKERIEFLKFMEAKKAAQEDNFQRKALLSFCSKMGIDTKQFKLDDELSPSTLLNEFPTLPCLVEARRLEPVSITKFYKRCTKQPCWDMFFQILEETDKSHVALIVNTKGLGLHVLHNMWYLPIEPGHMRMVRISAVHSEKGVIFEPLSGFAASLRKVWTP